MRTLIINAGGKSSRFKNNTQQILDKAWLLINGKSIIYKNILSLYHEVNEIIVIVRNSTQFKFFQEKLFELNLESTIQNKIRLVKELDSISSTGPIRGIITAVKICSTDILWVIPCDHPYITSLVMKTLEKNLSKNNIVTFVDEKYSIDPQLFVVRREMLLFASKFVLQRPTDLYRIIPSSKFLIPQSKEEIKAMLNLNTPKLMKQLKIVINQIENISVSSDTKFSELKRKYISLDVINKSERQKKIPSLILDEKHYFLLKQVDKIERTDKMDHSPIDLLFLEWKLWKPICSLIAFHCGIDFLKNCKKVDKRKKIVENYVNQFTIKFK
jgi:molybdopterin-guanine dinucleotide biosynthesis protein A